MILDFVIDTEDGVSTLKALLLSTSFGWVSSELLLSLLAGIGYSRRRTSQIQSLIKHIKRPSRKRVHLKTYAGRLPTPAEALEGRSTVEEPEVGFTTRSER